MIRTLSLLPLTLALLGSCVPRPLHVQSPARADALDCARTALEQLGYSITSEARSGQSLWAERTASSEWVYHIRHVVHVSVRENASSMLHLKASRLEDRIPGRDAPPLREEDRPSSRVLPVDEALRAELQKVMQMCSAPAALALKEGS